MRGVGRQPVHAALDYGDVLDQQLRACPARHHELVRAFVDEVVHDDAGLDLLLRPVRASRTPAGCLRLLEHPFGIFSAVTFRGRDDR